MSRPDEEKFVLKIAITNINSENQISKDLVERVNALIQTLLTESTSGSKLDYKVSFCDTDNNPN